MSGSIARVQVSEFVGEALAAHESIHVILSGNADMQVRDALRLLLRDVHAAATLAAVGEVVLDIRPLVFLSSSCISALVGWTTSIAADGDGHTYRVRIVWTSELGWRPETLRAIARVTPDIVSFDPLP